MPFLYKILFIVVFINIKLHSIIEESPSKKITWGTHLHDKIMEDLSSFSLGITQKIAASLAKVRANEKEESNLMNEPISQGRSSEKKRK